MWSSTLRASNSYGMPSPPFFRIGKAGSRSMISFRLRGVIPAAAAISTKLNIAGLRPRALRAAVRVASLAAGSLGRRVILNQIF